ncbi:uncharacterized protein [Ptychodera flava]|uniref:uncharacterized protein isoform X2 n=1 Tax=Ptychodera flava TaxID=63121 RepID=UPI003969F878
MSVQEPISPTPDIHSMTEEEQISYAMRLSLSSQSSSDADARLLSYREGSNPSTLLICNKWNNGLDRVAIVNQSLATQLAEKVPTYSTMLEVKDYNITEDKETGVRLVSPNKEVVNRLPNRAPNIEWLLVSHASYFSHLKSDIPGISLVLGHFAVDEDNQHLANAGLTITNEVAGGSQFFLFNHEIGEDCGKIDVENSACKIASEASAIFSVGPYVYEHYRTKYQALKSVEHVCYYPDLNKQFSKTMVQPYSGSHKQILTICNVKSKDDFCRYDVVAMAMGKVGKQFHGVHETVPVWKLYGVNERISDDFRKYLIAKSQCGHLNIPAPYSNVSLATLKTAIQQSVLLLAPEKKDPFNFAAYLAMQAGLPTLVPSCSGINVFLDRLFPGDDYSDYCSVDTGFYGNTAETDSKNWCDKIISRINPRTCGVAFKRADEIKKKLVDNPEILQSQKQFIQKCQEVLRFQNQFGDQVVNESMKSQEPQKKESVREKRPYSVAELSNEQSAKVHPNRRQSAPAADVSGIKASQVPATSYDISRKSSTGDTSERQRTISAASLSSIDDSEEVFHSTESPVKTTALSTQWAKQLSDLKDMKTDSKILESEESSKLYKVCKKKKYLIARGQDGTKVYLGIDMEQQSGVAVKCINNDSELDAKDIESTMSKNSIIKSHSNIVQYHDFIADDDFLYILMELCERTLDEYLKHEKMPQKKRKKIVLDMLNGLKCLHDANIVHRDLKPQNILIGCDGTAKLTDFGISRQLDMMKTQKTFQTGVAGTPCWLPTEAMTSEHGLMECSLKGDIQVAGMLMYYILSDGHHPFGKFGTPKDIAATQHNISEGKYILFHLDCVIAKHLIAWMLAKERKARPSMKEVLGHPYFWEYSHCLEFIVKLTSEADSDTSNVQHLHLKQSDEKWVEIAAVGPFKNELPGGNGRSLKHFLQFAKNCNDSASGDNAAEYIMTNFPDMFISVYDAVHGPSTKHQ